MDDCIEREPLLKAFKEKCCQDCPGGYSHQQCHSWCDAASEIEMIENAPAVNNTPQQWQNSRLHPPTEADADRTGGIIVWAYLPQPPQKQEDATNGATEPQC